MVTRQIMGTAKLGRRRMPKTIPPLSLAPASPYPDDDDFEGQYDGYSDKARVTWHSNKTSAISDPDFCAASAQKRFSHRLAPRSHRIPLDSMS